ncbi:hypothetical protein PVAP13_6NG258562 [Panicum virgatum]|uniref:Uncharacterized protein n=1 Tax=Panicum virgatum TaxID=38727 RepID=A0A8T0R2H3_PANVG|nr:hypothetical protein PVAP13_6NG258562 [Panicum virgatum]
MVHVRIFCHADIQALQRSDQKLVYVDLVSLESLRIASDSCALLVNLIQRRDWQCTNLLDRRYWHCHQMDLLSLMAGVALELHKIKHDLYPLLVSQEAKLEGGFLKDLRLLKNSAVTLVRLAKEAKEIVEGCVDEEDVEDVHVFRLLGKVKEVGKAVEDTADLVLKGTHNIAWLQAHLPSVLDPVDLLLSAPVLFPDPD